jgi:hypothetical protein
MTLLTVVQDVCAAVGVERPASVFAGINANRTMTEMLALANEMAQRIAYDTRDWVELILHVELAGITVTGTSAYSLVPLPDNFKRMLLTTNVRRVSTPVMPMRFIADYDEWIDRALRGYFDSRGEWMRTSSAYDVSPALSGNIVVRPPLAASDKISFTYLDKNCIRLASGGFGDAFLSDGDTFRLNERLLKLAMVWQWKALKGSPYAEDMANYQDALGRVAGADKPAPIIIGRMSMSSSMATSPSYPFPV